MPSKDYQLAGERPTAKEFQSMLYEAASRHDYFTDLNLVVMSEWALDGILATVLPEAGVSSYKTLVLTSGRTTLCGLELLLRESKTKRHTLRCGIDNAIRTVWSESDENIIVFASRIRDQYGLVYDTNPMIFRMIPAEQQYTLIEWLDIHARARS